MKIAAIFAGVCAALICSAATAKTVESGYDEITYYDQYSGDTLVFLKNNPAGCEQGFWLRPSHGQFKDNIAKIEKAMHAHARVKIAGNDAQRWKQTEDNRCRLQSVSVEQIARPVSADPEEQPVIRDSNDEVKPNTAPNTQR
jgi:hypothetical protein